MEMEERLPYCYPKGELIGEQLLLAERVTAAISGGVIRMGDDFERIIARDKLERSVLSHD